MIPITIVEADRDLCGSDLALNHSCEVVKAGDDRRGADEKASTDGLAGDFDETHLIPDDTQQSKEPGEIKWRVD
ncbi:MAG: hypothetical protein Q8M65_08105, partial [Rhodoglobus sp.]|nr:hypothetical protein [Rhodoglobus sp.]